MAGLQDFIQIAARNFGIDEGAARAGTGGLLAMVQERVDGPDFQQLLGHFPDGAAVLAQAPAAGAAAGGTNGGGRLGGLLGQAAGALGGKAGAALSALAMLQRAGIRADQAGRFASEFLKFVKSRVPADLVQKLLSQAGDLKSLAG